MEKKSKEYKLLKNKKNVSLLRKYSSEINWWVFTKRYKNGHMVEVLPVDILDDMLKISNDLMEGYYLKEEFLDIIHHHNQMDVEKQITKWISKCIEKNIPKFVESAGTISRWKEYILNSFIDERYSNGYTEGINNKIKVIKRIALGFRSFHRFKARIMICKNLLHMKKASCILALIYSNFFIIIWDCTHYLTKSQFYSTLDFIEPQSIQSFYIYYLVKQDVHHHDYAHHSYIPHKLL